MTEICTNFKIDDLDWEKCEHMIPVIVQHYRSGLVLMQGFMNREALEKTLATGKVTFFSRTKQRLWTKGEESHHYLNCKALTSDCDNDCLLAAVDPDGPTCHLGNESCFEGHPLLPTQNLALFEASKSNEPDSELENALAEFKTARDKKHAASLLKSVMQLMQKNGIALADIDAEFAQMQAGFEDCGCCHGHPKKPHH